MAAEARTEHDHWRHRRAALYASTALAAILCAGLATQPALGQSVTVTGPVSSSPVGSPPVWETASAIAVGTAGSEPGILTIENGGKLVTTSSGNSFLGASVVVSGDVKRFSNGIVTVSGRDADGTPSMWRNSGGLVVGGVSAGVLTITNGGEVSNANAILGLSANTSLAGIPVASGTATVSGNGSTWRNFGSLIVGDDGMGVLTVENGGTVSSSFTQLGARSSGTGTVELLGTASGRGVLETGYVQKINAGTLTLNGGILRAGSNESNFLRNFGALTIGTGGAWIDSNDHAITIGPTTTFTGSSGLLKLGLGTLTLTGDSAAFTGTTTVSGGELIVGTSAGGALGGTIIVDNGLLGGTGTVDTVTINAGGIHAPGNSIGVQHVAGDYVNHGTLRIEATPTDADLVTVAGKVDIAGATLDLQLSPGDAASWGIFNGPFTIIDNQGDDPVTGSFLTPATRNLLFLDAVLAYDAGNGNDVTLSLERNASTFAGLGETPNQTAAAAAIESLGNTNPLWASVALTSDPDIVRASFDALSGELHAGTRSALLDDSRFLRDAINTRLVLAANRTTFWSHGFGALGTLAGDGNAAPLDHATGGLLLGADGLAGDWRLGLVAGIGQSQLALPDRAATARIDNYHVGLYAGTKWENLAFRIGAAYTGHTIHSTRSIAIPGVSDSLSATREAGTLQAFGEFGYGLDLDATHLEPFANFAYVRLHESGFAEQGGAAALSGAGGASDLLFTTLGLRAEHDFTLGDIDATLRGMLGWRHAFGATTPTSAQGFATGSGFIVAGTPLAADSAVLEADLALALSPAASFGLTYTGQFAPAAQSHAVKASLAVSF